jgi:hypothetical protein
VWVVATNLFFEEYTVGRFAFFALASWGSCAPPRFLDDFVDGAIDKACAASPVVGKLLVSGSGSVYRGARECGARAGTWASRAALNVLRWCAYAALVGAGIVLGAGAGAAMYAASFALVIHAAHFVVLVLEAWRDLDDASRSCCCRAALFMGLQRLACVGAVRCGVVAAVSGAASLLQAAAQFLTSAVVGIVSFLLAPAAPLAAGAVLVAAVPARALVLSVRAVARGLVAGIRKARPVVDPRAVFHLTHAPCDLEFAQQVRDCEDDRSVAYGAQDVETTKSAASEAGATEAPPAASKGAGVVAKQQQHATKASSPTIKHSPGFRALARQIFAMEKAASSRSDADEAQGPAAAAEPSAQRRRSHRLLAKL